MDEVLLPSRAEQNAFLGFLTYTVLLNSSVLYLRASCYIDVWSNSILLFTILN